MKFDFTTLVGGRPLSFARDFLRRDTSFTVPHAARLLMVSEKEAAEYVAALVEAGYMEREREARGPGKPEVFVPTALGISLRKARKTKRLQRSSADQAVAALMAAIERINADPDLLSWVEEADLFGSYAAGAEEVGDVDVAIRLARRLPGKQWVEASLARADQAGSRADFAVRVTWGEHEVWRALRAASRHLDLQPKEDILTLGCPLKPLYRRPQS